MANIIKLVEQMVPRVTQPAGSAYLNTFRKIAWFLYNDKEAQSRDALRINCGLTKKACEEHPRALVEIGLIEESRKPYDKKIYYSLSDNFYQALNKSADMADAHSSKDLVDQVAEELIEAIESNNSVLNNLQPDPSKPLECQSGEFKSMVSEDSKKVPCSLAKSTLEGKYFDSSNLDDILDK